MRSLLLSLQVFAKALWWGWVLVVVTIVCGSLGLVQYLMASGVFGPDAISRTLIVPASGWYLASVASFLGAAFVAFHRLRVERDEQIGKLSTQLDDRWRKERHEFEALYDRYRSESSQFFMTIKNLLIGAGDRQMTSTWREYLPTDPRHVDAVFYSFAVNLWFGGWPRFGSESAFEAFKDRFRVVHGFFDRVYDLLREFPEQAPAYIDEEIRRTQYDGLHIVWYFGHALAFVTFRDEKASVYATPPRWDRLWNEWNPGIEVPAEPREAIRACRAVQELHDSDAS